MDELGSFGDSWEEVLSEVFLSDSDCEIVKPPFSSFSRKRQAEDVNVASSAEDVQQLSRRSTQEVDCEKLGSGSPVDCKKDAELLGRQ